MSARGPSGAVHFLPGWLDVVAEYRDGSSWPVVAVDDEGDSLLFEPDGSGWLIRARFWEAGFERVRVRSRNSVEAAA
jgi:hypothetical protein